MASTSTAGSIKPTESRQPLSPEELRKVHAYWAFLCLAWERFSRSDWERPRYLESEERLLEQVQVKPQSMPRTLCVPKDDTLVYHELLKRGRSLVIANVNDDDLSSAAKAVFNRLGTEEVTEARKNLEPAA